MTAEDRAAEIESLKNLEDSIRIITTDPNILANPPIDDLLLVRMQTSKLVGAGALPSIEAKARELLGHLDKLMGMQ